MRSKYEKVYMRLRNMRMGDMRMRIIRYEKYEDMINE